MVSGYNLDDCLSTMRLRDWLEERREELIHSGHPVTRPALEAGTPSEAVDEHQQRIQALYERLAGDVSPDPAERSDGDGRVAAGQHARLAPPREEGGMVGVLPPLRPAAGGAARGKGRARRPGIRGDESERWHRSVIDRYRFPPQECEIRARDDLRDGDGAAFGKAEAVDGTACILDIRKGPSIAGRHPGAVFKHSTVCDGVKRDAILRVGQWVAENGIDADGPYRAARDLLLRRMPRPGFGLVARGEDRLLPRVSG